MRLSNYILYGTTAFIVCLAIGYSIYIAFPKNNQTSVGPAEFKKSLEQMTLVNASLEAEIKELTREKIDANEALKKATEISKKRDDEIAKLNEQLATLSAIKKSKADILNQQVITDLVGLLKCSVTEIANQTNFSLEENVRMRGLLASANEKLIASQQRIDTLSSQVSRMQLVNAAQNQPSEHSPLIPPFQMKRQQAGGANPKADPSKKETQQLANLDKSEGNDKEGRDKEDSGEAGNPKATNDGAMQNTEFADNRRKETASRAVPSENEIALSKERQRLINLVSKLQSKLENRENLLLAQSSLIEELEKQSTRTETTFRRKLETESTDESPKPFREIGTFKSVIR